jgi:hypothetical protein
MYSLRRFMALTFGMPSGRIGARLTAPLESLTSSPLLYWFKFCIPFRSSTAGMGPRTCRRV